MISIGAALGTIVLVALAVLTGYRGPGQERSFGGPEFAVNPKMWPQSPETVNFAVIGDAGTGSKDQFRVARQMAETYQELPFGLLLTTGDNVYGGSAAERAAEVIEKPYKPLFNAGVEYRPTLGNHDVEHDDDLSETLATLGMPGRYYSFTAGPVEFFALDSNGMDGEQLTWLIEELSCSDSEWQVTYMHHPIYSSGKLDLFVKTPRPPGAMGG